SSAFEEGCVGRRQRTALHCREGLRRVEAKRLRIATPAHWPAVPEGAESGGRVKEDLKVILPAERLECVIVGRNPIDFDSEDGSCPRCDPALGVLGAEDKGTVRRDIGKDRLGATPANRVGRRAKCESRTDYLAAIDSGRPEHEEKRRLTA